MLLHLPGMNSSLTPSFWRGGLSSRRSSDLTKAPGVTESVQSDTYPSATSPRLQRSVQTKNVPKLLTRDSLETQGQWQSLSECKIPSYFVWESTASPISFCARVQPFGIINSVSTTPSKEGRARGSHTRPGNDFTSSTSSGKKQNQTQIPAPA